LKNVFSRESESIAAASLPARLASSALPADFHSRYPIQIGSHATINPTMVRATRPPEMNIVTASSFIQPRDWSMGRMTLRTVSFSDAGNEPNTSVMVLSSLSDPVIMPRRKRRPGNVWIRIIGGTAGPDPAVWRL